MVMTNTKVTAKDRRITGVADFCNDAFAEGYCKTRAQYVEQIRALAPLGKTEKWKTIIEKWATMMENVDNPVDWVILQYGIYAGYAC